MKNAEGMGIKEIFIHLMKSFSEIFYKFSVIEHNRYIQRNL